MKRCDHRLVYVLLGLYIVCVRRDWAPRQSADVVPGLLDGNDMQTL